MGKSKCFLWEEAAKPSECLSFERSTNNGKLKKPRSKGKPKFLPTEKDCPLSPQSCSISMFYWGFDCIYWLICFMNFIYCSPPSNSGQFTSKKWNKDFFFNNNKEVKDSKSDENRNNNNKIPHPHNLNGLQSAWPKALAKNQIFSVYQNICRIGTIQISMEPHSRG